MQIASVLAASIGPRFAPPAAAPTTRNEAAALLPIETGAVVAGARASRILALGPDGFMAMRDALAVGSDGVEPSRDIEGPLAQMLDRVAALHRNGEAAYFLSLAGPGGGSVSTVMSQAEFDRYMTEGGPTGQLSIGTEDGRVFSAYRMIRQATEALRDALVPAAAMVDGRLSLLAALVAQMGRAERRTPTDAGVASAAGGSAAYVKTIKAEGGPAGDAKLTVAFFPPKGSNPLPGASPAQSAGPLLDVLA